MRYTKTILTAALAVAGILSVTPAGADTIPNRQRAPVAAAYDAPMPHIWTGVYGGLQIAATSANTDFLIGADGYSYGGRVGADAQLGSLLIGGLADYNFRTLNIMSSTTDATEYMFGARAGVVVGRGGGTLLYGLVGRKETKFKDFDMSVKGLVVGGGAEMMIWNNWSAAVEYQRLALDDFEVRDHSATFRIQYRFPVKALQQ